MSAALLFVWTLGSGAAQSSDHKKLLVEADAIAKKVSQQRGLAIKRPIRRGVMNKAQVTERLLKRVRQEYKPDEIAAEELAMKRLGLLPPDARYLDIVIDLLTEQIAGFYDPWDKQLYIADWLTMGQDAIMAHEITHALQDQHFGLQKWMAADKKNADATLARQALVEGDGLAAMIEFSSPAAVPWGQEGFVENISGMIAMGMTTLGDVPLVLRDGLVFPYMGGLRLIGHVRRSHPWKAVNAMYARPPLSTEHVMHPRTYDEYERPVVVRPASGAPAPLKGYKSRYDNVMGQLGWSVFLRQHKVGEITARIAAAGWGGDHVVIYTPPGAAGADPARAVAVLYSTWDSEVDAVEFFTAADDALASLAGATARPTAVVDRVEHPAPGGTLMVAERRGDAVLLLLGASVDQARPLTTDIWKTWSRR